MSTTPIQPEPGYTTTEFWVTVVTGILSALVAFNVIHVTSAQTQTIAGVIGMIVPVAIYALSRGIRKAGT